MVIKGEDITYRYPEEPDTLFASLDFEIKGPGFISLFGLSGTGKSTLARLISGELSPISGSIKMDGQTGVLYAWNAERLPGWCSVGEHIRQVTPSGRADVSRHLANALDVEPLFESRFRELSMGQKNRVNLLRYLLQDFDLLIADEVLANVDEPSRNRILGAIKSTFPQRTFLYISHNATEVVRFSKEIVILPVSTPHRRVATLKGLDITGRAEPDPSELQQRVLELLQKAASEPLDRITDNTENRGEEA